MAEFDMDAYLRRRPFNPNGTDKLQALQEATQTKIKALSQYSAERQVQKEAAAASLNESVVGMAGLDPDGVAGTAVNEAVRLGAALSKTSGMVGSGIWDLIGAAENINVSDEVKQARANELAGKATQADLELLARPVGKLTEGYKPKPGHATNRDRVQQMEESFKNAQDVREFFDLSNRVYQGDTKALQNEIKDSSQGAVAKVREGVQQVKDGSYLDGAGNVASGVAESIGNALTAGKNNPKAVVESLIDQAPNLLSAAAGSVPGTAYNLLYGLDTFGEGVQAKVKQGKGALPSDAELAKTAGWAAASAAAEIAGDKLMDITGVLKGAGKAATKAGEDVVEEVTRKTLKERLLGLPAAVNDSAVGHIAKATVKGGAGEYLTEGTQTATEAAAKGQDATLEDVNLGASLGLLTGAPMSGGVHTLQEVGKAAAGIAEKQADKAQANLDQVKAIEANDTSAYLDTGNADYDPVKATQVLYGHAQLESTSAETKQQNIEKAHDILAGLETERAQLQSQLDRLSPEGLKAEIDRRTESLDSLPEHLVPKAQQMISLLQEELDTFDPKAIDPKGVKSLQTKLTTVNRQIAESTKLRDQLAVENKPDEQGVTEAVERADSVPDTTNPESVTASKAAVDHVVSLAMAHPDSFSDEHLERLVKNQNNGLSAPQRSYLRSLSETRIAENALKNLGIVENEVMNGDPTKNQLGIKDYRQRMQDAVVSRNEEKAATAVHMLGKFATAHKQKLRFFMTQFSKVGKTGAVNVVPTSQGWQVAPTQDISQAGQVANRKQGGMTISAKSVKLIRQIQAESKALDAAHQQLRDTQALRFAPEAVPPVAQISVDQTESVDSSQPSQAQGTAPQSSSVEQPVTPQSTEGQDQSNVDNSVDPAPTATKLKKPRTRIEPKNYQNIVGAILKVTGGEGIASKVARDLLGDNVKELKNIRPAVRANGWQDVGQLISYLRDEGYVQLNTEEDLVNMLRDHMNGIPGRTAAQLEEEAAATEERKAKAEAQSFRREVNQSAKEKGIKQARGKRTLDDVLADLALWEEKRNALEAEEERIAIQAEAAMYEAANSADVMQELAEVAGYTKEEIERVRIENRESEERPVEATEGTTEASRGDRENAGQAEKGEGANGEAGKLSVFQQVTDIAGQKFAEVFKGINLIAHNLVQKVGKDKATQRPLVAAKDFLSQWTAQGIDLKGIESFVGSPLSSVQESFLEHFRKTAEGWKGAITKNLVKGQVTAGIKFKQAVKEAYQLPAKDRAAALAKIEQEFKGKKPGDVSYEEWKRYTNPIQFLIELDESGKADMEENVKTAIAAAAFMYVAENAKAPQLTSLETVKEMFGVSEYDIIGDALYDKVSRLGSPERSVIISMGQRVTQALGFSAKDEATQDFLARLEADLGAHVMKLLVDQGIIERNVVPRQEISAGLSHLEKHDATKQGDMAFLRMVRSEGKTARDRKLNSKADQISTMAKGTHGVLGKLFGVEAQVKEPSWEPIKAKQTTTANTDQAVPDDLTKIVVHENSVANYVRKDVWTLLQGLGEEAFLELAGYIHPDESTMHKTTITAIEVSNEALRRELSAAVDYFGSLEQSVSEEGSPEGLKQALYLAHSVWKQQRVGVDGVINPQSSKIHRWMLTRADWLTKVSSDDTDMMNSFMLRVGEGLGVKTDKQANEKSLEAVKALFDTKSADLKTREKAEILQAAVDALIRSRQPAAEMSDADSKAIQAGVEAGGEKMHSLDALIAMANYQEAKAKAGNASFTFEVQLMGEVDGVTNGPMLSHLALGAGNDATALLTRLNRGGFFQEESGFANYNVWRGTPGHTDLYESTTLAVINHISKQADKAATFERLQRITGTLYNTAKGTVEKAGRNIIKTPLTAMLFGSTVKGAVASMFRDFIVKSYEGFEAIAKMKAEENPEVALVAYVDNLNALLGEARTITERIPHGSLEFFLTEFEFSEAQTKALEEVFNANLGESVKATMEKAYGPFLKMRDTINDTANATFGMYNAAYQGIRQTVIAELIAEEAITVGKDGKPLHDLTPDQEKRIEERVAALNPEVQTYMSKHSKNAKGSGLHVSKSARQLSTEKMYQNVSQFGKPFPAPEGKFGALSLRNAAYQRVLATPGVAMVPMMIHAMDSAISHLALMGRQVLNVHDAHGTGLKDFTKTAQALNQATWKVLLDYSPAAEMRDAFRNTLFGMDELLKSGTPDEAVITEVRKYLNDLAEKHGTWVDGVKVPMDTDKVLIAVAGRMFHATDRADRIKYEAMAQLQYVDQYALEGGQYEVSEADRKEAQRLLGLVGDGSMPGSVWNAIDRINAVVLGTQVSPITSPYGALGESSIPSDTALTRFFEDKETRTAAEVIAQIKKRVSPANRVLLNSIQKLIDPNLSVRMITSRTPNGDTLSKEANARGWFAYKGNVSSVHVLSPEFKLSGLTPELLVHELLHAALAKTINHPNTPEAKALLKSLEQIKHTVVAHLDAHPELKQRFPMQLDVHELVSWGMSDLAFQQEVLAQIPMVKAKVGNKLMSAMMGFIKAISKFLGVPLTVKDESGQEVDNALAALIQDVSGLFEQAKNPDNGQATDAFSATMEAVQHMTTFDVYEALDEGKVAPTHDAQLRNLLDGIANKLHGPYGTFKALVESQIASTPKDLWLQAKGQGTAPFGSAALAAGIPMNDQVAFVLEQVEASVHGALEANTGAAHDVYVELNRLYQEARTKLENNPALSQDLRDFLFKMDAGQGGRSRHLARFAALGLAHPEVNAALQINTERAPLAVSGSFAHRLESLFQKVLEWFNGRLTHTFAGQQADAKLRALVTQLVDIEAKRKAPILQTASTLDFVENTLKQGTARLKDKVEQFGKSDWVRNRKSSLVRATGAVISTVAGERTEAVMNHIQAVRDRQMNQGFGLAMGVINEIRGMHDGNKMFHRLIREAKLREGMREDLIVHTGNTALESFANQGRDLTQADKNAITAGLLRADIAALLDNHSMTDITKLLSDPVALDREIARLEGLLAPYRQAQGFYERYAKNLGYKLATGKVKGLHTLMNASNIASLTGTGMEHYVTQADIAAATPIIDQLASLYAYRYTKPAHKMALAGVLAKEAARGKESGVEMVLKLHKSLQQQSKERLFEGSEALMMKGYTPEIYDPKKEVVVATEQEGAKLEAQGYIKGKKVAPDPLDPDRTERFVYKRDGGGLRPWLSGIISYTGETAKGSRSKTDNVQNLTEWKANKQDLRNMQSGKRAAMQREFRHDPNYDPSQVDANFAAPVVNPQGGIVDYRYLMAEDNKDDLLNRDSRFDKVLGFFAGSVYDKESTKESNRKAIQAMYDQYKADFATRSESYRKVGPDSSDPELQDIYRMLPEDTKQAIREIWGRDYMLVRSDLMDINFGYRKISMTDAFHKEHKNVADQLFTGLWTHVWGDKAEYNLRRIEDVWQEIVAETKEILVIKNLSTLIGNVLSNISLLYWQGVPLKDMARYHRIAVKGVSNYRADSAALIDLETKLAANYITTTRREMEREVVRLKDALANNPVKELIDAGLMPSIVEDVSPEDDMYSYKSRLVHYVEGHTSSLNKQVLSAARTVYMAKDTKMYKALHHATQLSDFVARYALYAHVTTRKQEPLSKADAIQLASDAFVNYDLPSHRKLQYMNDMGFTRFTKYYLRIQKVIAHMYAENPGRAMALLATEALFNHAPVLTESGFTHRMGNNPFSLGALDYPGVLDELATIKLGASVIR